MTHHSATFSIAPVKSVRQAPGHHDHAGHGAPSPGGGEDPGHTGHHDHPHHAGPGHNLDRTAWQATLHCLTGCAIGEVLGLVLGTWWGWGDAATIALAVTLAFMFGYALTAWPLLRSGLPARQALTLALQADTASIAVMEVVDNAVMLAIPGAMAASLDDALFWVSMALALALAAVAAFPVNRWLIRRGLGHAVVHGHH